MKKLFALIMAMIFVAFAFCSCGNGGETTTTPKATETTSPVNKDIKMEDGVLLSCIGQADADGVYTIPEGISFIGEGCFAYDVTLKKVIIPASVKVIGSGAFAGCTSLKEVVIEDGVETLGSHAFWGCNAIERIALPESIKEVSDYAFSYCSFLEEVTFGSGVTKIGYNAFAYCTALEKVHIPAETKILSGTAFLACSSLEEVDFSDASKLETIGLAAFGNCISLRRVELPESLKEIGQEAFYGCKSLVDVKIGSKVERIYSNAFSNTPWYMENNSDYLIVGDGVLIKCNVIPKYIDLSRKGIKVIGGTAFINDKLASGNENSANGYKYAGQLTSIVIPEGVTRIQTAAFYYCISLEMVELPSTLETIESSAFDLYVEGADLELTTKIDLSKCKNLKTIGASAFRGCTGIDTVDLPSTVEYIGGNAYLYTKAYSNFYEEVKDSKKPEFKTVNDILLWTYVPDGETILDIPDGIKIIAGGACTGWNSAIVPTSSEGLTPEWRSKYNISNVVTKIDIPASVERICDNAFYNVKSVKELIIPGNVETIGENAFYFCGGLERVTLEEGVKEISPGAFSTCTALSSISLPSTLEYIGSGAFASCSSLSSLVVPKETTEIDSSIFDSSCTSLQEVYLPKMLRPYIFSIMGDVSVNTKINYYKD